VSGTDVLLNVAAAAQLFHASDGTGFADLMIDGHRETWPLRGKSLWGLVAPTILRADLGCAERRRAERSPQCA
jgi:hypothetical protein